jgi:hypothetical protein
MLYPTHITQATGPSSSSSSNSSISYDYSGLDEINKRKDEANQLGAAKWKALYDGDVGGSVAAGDRIRSLLSSLKDIKPVRVSSESSSSDSSRGATSFVGEHEDLEWMRAKAAGAKA